MSKITEKHSFYDVQQPNGDVERHYLKTTTEDVIGFDEQILTSGVYVICETPVSNPNKVVTIDHVNEYKKGMHIYVRYDATDYTSPSNNEITLNINNLGAKKIYNSKNNSSGSYLQGEDERYFYNRSVHEYVYDGSAFTWVNSGLAQNNWGEVEGKVLGFDEHGYVSPVIPSIFEVSVTEPQQKNLLWINPKYNNEVRFYDEKKWVDLSNLISPVSSETTFCVTIKDDIYLIERNVAKGFFLGYINSKWEMISDYPVDSGLLENYTVIAAENLNDELHIITFESQTNTCEHFKYVNKMWIRVAELSFVLTETNSIVRNNELHLLFGKDINNALVNTHYVYNYTTEEWTEKSSLLYKIEKCALCVYNDDIYAMGGTVDGTDSMNGVTYIQIYTDNTYAISTLPSEFYSAYAVVANNELHLFGGYLADGTTISSNHIKYDGSSWSIDTTLPYAFAGGVCGAIDDEIHIIGGINASNTTKAWNTHYVLRNNVWETEITRSLGSAHAILTVIDNCIHVIGGYDENMNTSIYHTKFNNAKWSKISGNGSGGSGSGVSIAVWG